MKFLSLLPRIEIQQHAHNQQYQSFHKKEKTQDKLPVFIQRVGIGNVGTEN